MLIRSFLLNIMAELVGGAFLSSFFQVALQRLASTDFKGYFRKGLVTKLEITLNSINQVVDAAEEKQYQNSYVKKWLDELKHRVYEVDQLLDEIATSAEKKGKLQGFISNFTNQFESRMKELVNELETLMQQMEPLGLKQSTCCTSYESGLTWKSLSRLPTTSLVDASRIYGREGDKHEIINFLLSDNNLSGNQVPIISIVGLGGMGKTTLAQLVYNDHRIKEQFELKAWVYVSKSCDVVGLTKAILESFHFSAHGEHMGISKHGESFDVFQQQLMQILTDKTYVLVLDDVWERNNDFWERLLRPFNHGSSRGKIIVTTRDKNLASVTNFTKLVELKQLEESDCWSLFKSHAFQGNNVSEDPDVILIGKRIVDKCGGLPLAVKTLGNFLQRKSPHEWVKVLETDMWCLPEGDNNITPILRLSYHNLPSKLKRCFAYCSIFPKGYSFEKDELIKLWMAEGLLKTDKSGEELGNEFFEDLQSISFLQPLGGEFSEDLESFSFYRLVGKRSKILSTKYFIMHDLINDLAKSVLGEFCFQEMGDGMLDIPERTRHIWCSSLDYKNGHRKLKSIYKIKGLRSLVLKEKGYRYERLEIGNKVQRDMFSTLKHLRMLSFNDCDLFKLADEISNLKLLRYLDLSYTWIKRLPNSICTMYNLETLLLEGCELTELPSDFCKLVKLCHLNLGDYRIMGKNTGRHNGSDIKALEKLNHLRGTFGILGLENVTDPADASTANLKDKKHLEELRLMYDNYRGLEILREVLEALQPNSNLNVLTIHGYGGNRFPNWLGDCHLPNLVSLKLSRCGFRSQLPPLGQLPSLKKLSISHCRGIEIISEDFYGNNNSSNVPFRSLESLNFWFMPNWKEWVCVEGCFPLLKGLCIKFCSKLKMSLPQHLPSLQKLEIFSCDELESSIPKAANLNELRLFECKNIFVNELPSTVLKKVILRGGKIRFLDWSLQQNLFNGAILEELKLEDVSGFLECSASLDLYCCSTSSLRKLSMKGWRYTFLPFARLSTNLHSLELYDCPWLESFPAEGLPLTLSRLKIENCPKLISSREEWSLFQLNSLKELYVSDELENVECFPEDNLLPPTLITLVLNNCSKLRIINYKGLLHLQSLKRLSIRHCPYLERLPEDGLPNSLSSLEIINCSSNLKQMYQKEGGVHWHKIGHIPSVEIDYQRQE